MSPAEFIRQVKSETSKVTWLSRREVSVSTLIILFVVVIASLFFIVVEILSMAFCT